MILSLLLSRWDERAQNALVSTAVRFQQAGATGTVRIANARSQLKLSPTDTQIDPMAQFTTYWSGSETYKSEIKRFQSYFRSVLTKQQYQSSCLGEMNASHIAVPKCSYMYRNAHTDIKSISHISCMYKSGALWMIIDELGILQLKESVQIPSSAPAISSRSAQISHRLLHITAIESSSTSRFHLIKKVGIFIILPFLGDQMVIFFLLWNSVLAQERSLCLV